MQFYPKNKINGEYEAFFKKVQRDLIKCSTFANLNSRILQIYIHYTSSCSSTSVQIDEIKIISWFIFIFTFHI